MKISELIMNNYYSHILSFRKRLLLSADGCVLNYSLFQYFMKLGAKSFMNIRKRKINMQMVQS